MTNPEPLDPDVVEARRIFDLSAQRPLTHREVEILAALVERVAGEREDYRVRWESAKDRAEERLKEFESQHQGGGCGEADAKASRTGSEGGGKNAP